MNSIISWVGGKKALRDLIYLRMPKHYDRYIEVFGGGGWVLFGKPPDKCMEVYNDFNSNLANLFYCVKERPMALLRELSFLPLNSRDEFVTLRKFLTMEVYRPSPTTLKIYKTGQAILHHYIARLEIPVKECILILTQQQPCKFLEFIFENTFIELYTRPFEKTIFEIVQIPHYRAIIKVADGITHRKIKMLRNQVLYFWQLAHHPA